MAALSAEATLVLAAANVFFEPYPLMLHDA